MANDPFKFNISLSVLNHLGRNLYRSFATVLGEAISNAWDANAHNVWIEIDRDNDQFCIKDDGVGMTVEDFQNKFLKIGYSKRRSGEHRSAAPENRPYIGRKGIGKLALLSCAQKISITSKVAGGGWVGGSIDNTELENAILDDVSAFDYELDNYNDALFGRYREGLEHGTIICFEGIKDGIHNTDDFLRKIIALYFRFSLIDPNFNIFLDGDPVTLDSLSELADKTQFVWNINAFLDPYLDSLCTNIKETISVTMAENISGFIASVKKPKDRNIHATNEKVGVDLFVNGRLRESDILKHIPSSRVPESYLYGQIHFNALDGDGIDRFTSSREGVLADDPAYKSFLDELRMVVLRIIDQWDALRDKYDEDGDLEGADKFKKAKSLVREVSKEYSSDGKNDPFLREIANDAAYNSSSYAQCFISENLLRRQIELTHVAPTTCSKILPTDKSTCLDRFNPKVGVTALCEFCKGERGKASLQTQKSDAKVSIQIRSDEDNILLYLDYVDLANILDHNILKNEDKMFKSLRNSVMHTALLTEEAKTRLTSVFDNIVATIKKLTT